LPNRALPAWSSTREKAVRAAAWICSTSNRSGEKYLSRSGRAVGSLAWIARWRERWSHPVDLSHDRLLVVVRAGADVVEEVVDHSHQQVAIVIHVLRVAADLRRPLAHVEANPGRALAASTELAAVRGVLLEELLDALRTGGVHVTVDVPEAPQILLGLAHERRHVLDLGGADAAVRLDCTLRDAERVVEERQAHHRPGRDLLIRGDAGHQTAQVGADHRRRVLGVHHRLDGARQPFDLVRAEGHAVVHAEAPRRMKW
jgi:hypothetical protein